MKDYSEYEEDLVSFKTAKLAHEVGFDIPCELYYDENPVYRAGFVLCNGNIDIDGFQHETYYRCPTQIKLKKWIQNKHTIFISTSLDRNCDPAYWFDIFTYEHFGNWEDIKDKSLHGSRLKEKDIMEDALIEALTYIKNNRVILNIKNNRAFFKEKSLEV